MHKFEHYAVDDVWLESGFQTIKVGEEEFVRYDDVEGLENELRRCVLLQRSPISANQLRFLRKGCEMSQSALAKELAVDTQTVARWEKGESQISVVTSIALKTFFAQRLGSEISLPELLSSPSDRRSEKIVLRHESRGWVCAEDRARGRMVRNAWAVSNITPAAKWELVQGSLTVAMTNPDPIDCFAWHVRARNNFDVLVKYHQELLTNDENKCSMLSLVDVLSIQDFESVDPTAIWVDRPSQATS